MFCCWQLGVVEGVRRVLLQTVFPATREMTQRHRFPTRSFRFLHDTKAHRSSPFDPLAWPLGVAVRLVQLQAIFGPLLLSAPLLYACGLDSAAWTWMRWCLVQAGPAFIKLGQWAAVRPDILPRALCQVLSTLHTSGTVHDAHWTRRLVAESIGWDGFDAFEARAIGSGSVGQVHAAVHRGLRVAVKVVHPGSRERFQRDLLLIAMTAGLVHAALPSARWIGLPEQVALFSEMMLRQLDLRYEAYTLQRFARNFRWSRRSVQFPRVILATRDVLIETLVEGACPVGRLVQQPSECEEVARVKSHVTRVGLGAFLQMLLWDNFVHADLHPGNILVKFRGAAGGSGLADLCRGDVHPAVVFIDTGMVTELHARDFANFTDLFAAMVVRGDGREAARLIMDRSPGDRRDFVDPEGFVSSLADIIDAFFAESKGRALKRATLPPIAPVLMAAFDLVRAHHVRLEPAFTNLVVSLACVESLGRELSGDRMPLLPLVVQAGVQYLATDIARRVTSRVQPLL